MTKPVTGDIVKLASVEHTTLGRVVDLVDGSVQLNSGKWFDLTIYECVVLHSD